MVIVCLSIPLLFIMGFCSLFNIFCSRVMLAVAVLTLMIMCFHGSHKSLYPKSSLRSVLILLFCPFQTQFGLSGTIKFILTLDV